MKAIDILWGKVEEKVVEETERVTPIGIGSVLSDGYIVYSETETEWLACAPASERVRREWGSSGTNRGTTSATDGYTNTNTLQSIGETEHPAAHYAWNNSRTPTDGGTGSYLPSKDELGIIYENKAAIDAVDTTGNFDEAYHWSSTEDSPTYSWGQYYSWGVLYGKDFSDSVVPMRRITKTKE